MSKPEEKAKVAAAQAVSGIDYGAEAGDGFTGMGAGDVSIPFLSILQSMSPEVTKTDGKYIKGAEVGQVINTVTRQVFEARASEGTSILVIPCGYIKRYVEWRPKKLGGGFIKAHEDAAILTQTSKGQGVEQYKDILPNGNVIETTAYHSVMHIHDGIVTPALIAMKSTQLKHSRKWNSKLASIRMKDSNTGKPFMPPMYAYKWHLSSRPEVKDGNTWFSWDMLQGALVTDLALFQESKQLTKSAMSGNLALPAPAEEPADNLDDVM